MTTRGLRFFRKADDRHFSHIALDILSIWTNLIPLCVFGLILSFIQASITLLAGRGIKHFNGLGWMPLNPYASYSVKQMYDFLSGDQLPRDIGARFEYSNFGAGLLGHVLSPAAGRDYETLIRTPICQPPGMRRTGITLSPELKSRLAAGHDGLFKPTSNWDLPTLAGAGALRSTANDMLSFSRRNWAL
jgi:hypothetical protein